MSSDFYPKNKCDEQELKYIITGNPASVCPKIPTHINKQQSRLVDFRAWTQNPYALITLNLDTEDQKLAKAGFSLRVRFSLTGGTWRDVQQVDMCIKTRLPSGINIVPINKYQRGEWEIHLPSLRPNMNHMIAENRDSTPPLPAFFLRDDIRNADFYVKTIGGTLRSVYPSYEKFWHDGRQLASVFQHTEDIVNVFMTPYADIITGQDTEVEAEFLGLKGVMPDDMSPEEFDRLMKKAMFLLDRTILKASPGHILSNDVSKADRARAALETVYGTPPQPGSARASFDMEARRFEATQFALDQRVRPEDVNLDNIWHYMEPLMVKHAFEQAFQTNPFEPPRLVRA